LEIIFSASSLLPRDGAGGNSDGVVAFQVLSLSLSLFWLAELDSCRKCDITDKHEQI
jgi:hypothetical protein